MYPKGNIMINKLRKYLCIFVVTLAIGGFLYYSSLESEKEQIIEMALSCEDSLSSIVFQSRKIQGVKQWGMQAGDEPYAGYSWDQQPFFFDAKNQIVEDCENIFSKYPFDKIEVFYDDAKNLKIDFSQTKKKGTEKITYHLVYFDPDYNLLLVPGSIDPLFQFDVSENLVLDNWYCVSQRECNEASSN